MYLDKKWLWENFGMLFDLPFFYSSHETKHHFMKKAAAFAPLLFFASTLIYSCQKTSPVISDNGDTGSVSKRYFPTSDTGCGPYTATLENKIDNGDSTWTWTWKLVNPNPGNGGNGTVQDLSNFGLKLTECMTIDNVLNASYSYDGINWISVPVTYQPNPAMKVCYQDWKSLPMIKFGVGTVGTQPIYYKVTIDQDLLVNQEGEAYYKSGSKTGCGTFCFPGFKCQDQ